MYDFKSRFKSEIDNCFHNKIMINFIGTKPPQIPISNNAKGIKKYIQ